MYMRSIMTAPTLSEEGWVALNRAFRQPVQDETFPVRLDVRETAEAYEFTADLPGMDKDSVSLAFEDGILSLSGERKLGREESEGANWRLVERRGGAFHRRIALKQPVDAQKIVARFDKGILSVTLPKQPQIDRAVKIDIQSA